MPGNSNTFCVFVLAELCEANMYVCYDINGA